MKYRLLSSIALLLMIVVSASGTTMYDEWEENYNVQALLGATKFENLKFDVEGSDTPVEVDLSTIPQLGGAWTTPARGDSLNVGLETSFLLGFQLDKVSFASSTNNALLINISTSMWMFDLAGGGYANLYLGADKNVRLYVAGGPLMTFASYRAKREFNDGSTPRSDTESVFGLGLYARTGFEFRVAELGMLGLGVRSTWANVDFSNVGGSSELIGISGFVTYTVGF